MQTRIRCRPVNLIVNIYHRRGNNFNENFDVKKKEMQRPYPEIKNNDKLSFPSNLRTNVKNQFDESGFEFESSTTQKKSQVQRNETSNQKKPQININNDPFDLVGKSNNQSNNLYSENPMENQLIQEKNQSIINNLFGLDDNISSSNNNQNYVSPPITQSYNPMDIDPFGFTDSSSKPVVNSNYTNAPNFNSSLCQPQQSPPINYGVLLQNIGGYPQGNNAMPNYPPQQTIQPPIYPQHIPQQTNIYQGYPNTQINNNIQPPFQGNNNSQPVTLNYGNFPTYSKTQNNQDTAINNQVIDESNTFKVCITT